MDWMGWLLPLALGWMLQRRAQQQRIVVLAQVLGRFQVEKLMETVADGYLRALGETDPERARQVWNMLELAEHTLRDQVQAVAQAFDAVDARAAHFSTLPVDLPLAQWLWPRHRADLRALLHIHASGISRVVDNAAGLARRDQAYMLTAELLLLQHSCHWFCRSKATASARLRARHGTPHAQLLAAVSAPTRAAYTGMLR